MLLVSKKSTNEEKGKQIKQRFSNNLPQSNIKMRLSTGRSFLGGSTCLTLRTSPCIRSQRQAVRIIMSSKSELWALDFDGVVCDSCGESALSAWKVSEVILSDQFLPQPRFLSSMPRANGRFSLQAASLVWPDVFSSEAVVQKEELVEKMRAVRPVVETGYENIVQIRCLLEGVEVDDMLNNWSKMLPEYMEKWNLDRAEVKGFLHCVLLCVYSIILQSFFSNK